ncbi:MAG TPA: DUF1015 domain-containing protein [Kofleriaceae bacterium]|nr:DUF1015 domain-containing protein [Kofleriaceae bacterium]
MPELAPFRGLLFDHTKVTLGTAVAPTAALVDPAARAALLASDPHNVARLIVADNDGEREASAKELAGWRASEKLRRDPSRSIYRIVETAPPAVPGARPPVRRGVIAAIRLETGGDTRMGVAERAIPARVEERVASLKATGLQVEPLLATYADAPGEVERLLRQGETRTPTIDLTTADGVRHQVWRIADAELIGKVRRAMMAKKLLLLDGAHAYAAMLAYRDHLASRVGGAGLAQYASPQYGLVHLCAANDEGLALRPTHRVLLDVGGFDRKTFLARAAEFFTVEVVRGGGTDAGAVLTALEQTHAHLPAIAVALPGERDAWRLTLDPHIDPRNHGVAGHPSVARLDVNLLHGLVFEHILGLGAAAQDTGRYVRYLTDPAAALATLTTAGVQAAFLLGTPKLEVVRHVADVNELLPPYSVRAFPELTAGLVSAAIDPDEDLM